MALTEYKGKRQAFTIHLSNLDKRMEDDDVMAILNLRVELNSLPLENGTVLEFLESTITIKMTKPAQQRNTRQAFVNFPCSSITEEETCLAIKEILVRLNATYAAKCGSDVKTWLHDGDGAPRTVDKALADPGTDYEREITCRKIFADMARPMKRFRKDKDADIKVGTAQEVQPKEEDIIGGALDEIGRKLLESGKKMEVNEIAEHITGRLAAEFSIPETEVAKNCDRIKNYAESVKDSLVLVSEETQPEQPAQEEIPVKEPAPEEPPAEGVDLPETEKTESPEIKKDSGSQTEKPEPSETQKPLDKLAKTAEQA